MCLISVGKVSGNNQNDADIFATFRFAVKLNIQRESLWVQKVQMSNDIDWPDVLVLNSVKISEKTSLRTSRDRLTFLKSHHTLLRTSDTFCPPKSFGIGLFLHEKRATICKVSSHWFSSVFHCWECWVHYEYAGLVVVYNIQLICA